MKLTIDLIDGTDENVTQLISVLQFGLSTAMEGELISPDFEMEIKSWMRSECVRLRPERDARSRLDALRESKWFGFWSSLEPEQEVRWTRTKNATYFVVTGELITESPAVKFRPWSLSHGPYVELRRHSGKTFWSHIAQVRPFGWIADQ